MFCFPTGRLTSPRPNAILIAAARSPRSTGVSASEARTASSGGRAGSSSSRRERCRFLDARRTTSTHKTHKTAGRLGNTYFDSWAKDHSACAFFREATSPDARRRRERQGQQAVHVRARRGVQLQLGPPRAHRARARCGSARAAERARPRTLPSRRRTRPRAWRLETVRRRTSARQSRPKVADRSAPAITRTM